MSATHSSTASLRVLFVSGIDRPHDGSRIYRGDHHVKQLRQAGAHAELAYFKEIEERATDSFDVLVMARCPWHAQTRSLIAHASSQGKLLLGEIDDEIFAPWTVEDTGYFRSHATPSQSSATRKGLRASHFRNLRIVPLMDAYIVSTPGLQDSFAALGVNAHVVRNAADLEVARPIATSNRRLSRMLVMTGTPTHDSDLRLIASPLARFLYENPAITCTFLGPFELPGALRGLSNITRRERLPMEELFPFIAEHDLCLVPLEDTSFNDCKSALKFLECGVVSVPVLASPRREFRELIRHAENGFLADDTEDSWYDVLCRLRDAPNELSIVARGAYASVMNEHTVQSRGTQLLDLLTSLHARRDQPAEKP